MAYTIDWDINETITEINEQVDITLENLASMAKTYIQQEVPIDTGLLLSSVTVGQLEETTEGKSILVGCDEAICYYAPFVYYPGVTRHYGGNAFIDRAVERLVAEDDLLAEIDRSVPGAYSSEAVAGQHGTIYSRM